MENAFTYSRSTDFRFDVSDPISMLLQWLIRLHHGFSVDEHTGQTRLKQSRRCKTSSIGSLVFTGHMH